MDISMMVFILAGIVPWLLMFGAAVYLIQLWKKPGPDQLRRDEVADLEEQVALMRDFLRDAMQRLSRLEATVEERRLPSGDTASDTPPEEPPPPRPPAGP